MRGRGVPILAALAAAALVTWLAFSRADLRTDMADFLPAGQTESARFMLRELRSGTAASLVLIGIEGAPPAELARISAAMAAGLEASGLFALVANGKRSLDGPAEQFLFRHRYLLVPQSDAFSAPALRASFERLLTQLRSSASPLATRIGLADPTGAFLELGRVWAGESQIRLMDGVWFAPDRDRALLVARTLAGGMNIAAQDRAAEAVAAAFAAATPGQARLLAAGPAVFARDAASAIRGDVERLSIFSSLLVAGLLLWRFRSPWALAAVAVPVVLSIALAVLAVQLAFGFVHGIALGFGMTMLGVTIDYPVLLIGHRKLGEAPAGTLARIGPAFRLAVATAAIGLTGMASSGFPGLSQLGLFSVVGVLGAAAATWWLLPRLVAAADLAPVSAGTSLLRVERLRAGRLWALAPVLAACAYLAAVGGPRRETDLEAMSPVPQASRDLDQQLRAGLGAPDVAQIAIVRDDSVEAVLQRQEALTPALDRLRAEGALAGAEYAARLLPSVATQRARQAALPDADTLYAAVTEARAGLPFRPAAFDALAADVATQRRAAPLIPADLSAPALAARLEPLLFERDGAWFGPVAFQGVRDASRLAAVLAGAEGVTLVDMRAEANGIVSGYTGQAWRWLGYGALAVLAALLIGLRDPRAVLRVAGPVAAALLVTVAVLTAFGTRLSLIHIVALQFVAGVGLDYALFFARRQLDEEERARTLRTLATCLGTTLLTFGLLATCRTPLLRDIGVTVAIGVVAVMCFSFLLAGERPRLEPGSA